MKAVMDGMEGGMVVRRVRMWYGGMVPNGNGPGSDPLSCQMQSSLRETRIFQPYP